MPAPKVEDLFPTGGPPKVEDLYPVAAIPQQHPVQSAVQSAIEGTKRLGMNLAAGFVGGLGGVDHTAANLLMVMDEAAHRLSRSTGLSYGGAFSAVEQHLRQDSDALMARSAQLAPGTSLPDKAVQLIGQLPAGVAEAAAAVGAAGPVAGFGALGAVQAADQGPLAAAKAGAAGLVLGSVFKATEVGVGRAARAVTVGTGSAALDLAQGKGDPQEIGLNAAANAAFAGLTARPPQKYTGVAPQAIPPEEAMAEKPRIRRTGILGPEPAIQTPKLFHETDARGASRILEGTRNLQDEIYLADRPELALGQAGRGVRLGFSENLGLERKPSLRRVIKPGSEFAEAQGSGREYVTLDSPTPASVLTVTIDRSQLSAKDPYLVRITKYLRRSGSGFSESSQGSEIVFQRVPATQTIAKPTTLSALTVTPRIQGSSEFLGRDYSDITPPDRVMNLNLRRITGPEDFKAATADFVNSFRDQIDQARRGQISHDQTVELAQDLGLTVETLLARRKGQALNAEEAVAYRTMNRSALEQWWQLSRKIRDGKATDTEKADFLKATAVSEAILEQTLGATAEAGRALSSFNIRVGPSTAQMKQLRQVISTWQGPKGEALEDFASRVAAVDSVSGLAEMASKWRKATVGDKLIEVWINGLLSAPPTHVANSLSNAMMSIWAIPQTAGAALVGDVIGTAKFLAFGERMNPDRVRFREAFAKTHGLIEGTQDGLRLAAKVFRSEQSASPTELFGPATTIERPMGSIGTEPGASRLARITGKLVRLPTRALMSMDAFSQAVAFRQELRAQALRKAINEGNSGASLGNRVGEILSKPDEELVGTAYQFSRRQTFTEDLGKFGRSVQSFANSHYLMRLILPFTRTPANIFKISLRNSPAALTLSEVRAEIAQGGAVRDMALAQMAMGSAVMAWAAAKAAGGEITGSGPADRELRASWLLDHQPFSVKVGNTWVSYGRVEPLATVLGIAADYSDIAGHIDDSTRAELATMLASSFRQNIRNKTFLQGLSSLAEAMDDPARFLDAFVQRLGGSVVPAGVANVARLQDPVLKDTRSVLDRIRSRIPGFSADLPPRRNVLGEPILLAGGLGPDMVSPLYRRPLRNDRTVDELVRVKAELSAPDPGEKIRGLELSAQEYSDLLADYGPKAKAMMDRIVSSPVYQYIPDVMKRRIFEDLYAEARKEGRERAYLRIIQGDPKRLEAALQAQIQERIGP